MHAQREKQEAAAGKGCMKGSFMDGYRVSVVIPTWKSTQSELAGLLEKLRKQSLPPESILLINTQRELFPCDETALGPDVRVIHISKEEFDHGNTRNLGMRETTGDVVVFMTQDALPADGSMMEELLAPFADPRVGASYARQLPREDCSFLERYTRSFNYPPVGAVKSREDLQQLGIKTFFCSNVCAAWRRSIWEQMGGFETKTIFNEDMILAGREIQAGYKIAYAAGAKVYHSHNYTGRQQFHRNFDLGVSQAQHPELFGMVSSGSEGIRLVRKTAGFVLKSGKPWLLFGLIWQSGCKYAGYWLGKRNSHLPEGVRRWCSLNKEYWD